MINWTQFLRYLRENMQIHHQNNCCLHFFHQNFSMLAVKKSFEKTKIFFRKNKISFELIKFDFESNFKELPL